MQKNCRLQHAALSILTSKPQPKCAQILPSAAYPPTFHFPSPYRLHYTVPEAGIAQWARRVGYGLEGPGFGSAEGPERLRPHQSPTERVPGPQRGGLEADH